MKKMELIAPCHFGLEAVLKREILDLGYEISEVEDGRVRFLGRRRGNLQCEYISQNSGESSSESRQL